MEQLYEVVHRELVKNSIHKGSDKITRDRFIRFCMNLQKTGKDLEFLMLVKRKYGEQAWEALFSMVDTLLERDDLSVRVMSKFYSEFINAPIERITGIIGNGADGACYKMGDDKVVKLFYETTMPRSISTIISRLQGKEFKTLPHIYHVGKSWYITDFLRTGKDLTSKEVLLITEIVAVMSTVTSKVTDAVTHNSKTYEDFITSVIQTQCNPAWKEANEFVEHCLMELQSIGLSALDIDSNNIDNYGVNSDGDVILFDPVYSAVQL